MKKYSERLIRLKFKGINPISGILLDYNDDWILIRSNPADYILDGYFVIRNSNLKKIRYGESEKWTEKVIRLKRIPALKTRIPLDSLESIVKTLNKQFGVFTVYNKKADGACWLGRLHSIDKKSLIIDDLTTKGKWDGQITFKTKDIRIIEFDTDYINSLKLLSKKVRAKQRR